MEENVLAQTTAAETPALQFRLFNPTEKGFLKRIEWNREELERAVQEKVAEYAGIVYTDDTIQMAKKDRATLNSLAKAINKRRIEIKKIINAPYDTFEKEIREITTLISEQSAQIDKQVKEYEAIQKSKRREAIMKYMITTFRECVPDFADVDAEKFYDSRWENITAKESEWKAAIDASAERVRYDIQVINDVEDEFLETVYGVYRKTFALSKAMSKLQELRKQKKMILEQERRRREAEEIREAQAEKTRLEHELRRQEVLRRQMQETSSDAKDSTEQKESTTYTEEKTAPEAHKAQGSTEKRYKASFTVYGTKDQIMALKEFMIENNIKFGKVER